MVGRRCQPRTALVEYLRKIPEGDIGEIARRADMDRRQLQRLRAGERTNIHLDTLGRLAEALGISAAELIGGSHPRRRGTTPGRGRSGRPRNIRRTQDAEVATRYDEDDDFFEEI